VSALPLESIAVSGSSAAGDGVLHPVSIGDGPSLLTGLTRLNLLSDAATGCYGYGQLASSPAQLTGLEELQMD
jgi:hypothetical protein